MRSKNAHGQRELTDFIADSIAKHRIPEGLVEKAMRVYGLDAAEMAERQLSQRSDSGEGEPSTHMAQGSPHRNGS